MGIRRPGTKGYEEVDGVNLTTGPANQNTNGHGIANNNLVSPEFELASVSVVPDGEMNHASLHLLNVLNIFRHIYCCAGGERFRIWMVSSQTVAFCGPLLDERLNGDDDLVSSRPGASLRLGHQSLSTSNGDHNCFPRHDVKQHFLGKPQR